MKKLEADKQFKPNNKKVKAILEKFGLNFLRFEELEKGLINVSLKVFTKQGVFVLRVLRLGRKRDAELMRELDYMEYMRKAKLPVPQIFKTKSGKEFLKYKDSSGFIFKCVLMEFMLGTHTKKYTKLQLKDLARVVAKMEDLGELYAREKHMKSKTKYKYYNIPPDKNLKITKPELKDFLHRSLSYKAEIVGTKHVGFHHVDLDHRNVLFFGNRVSAILDFDDCMLATTAHDLAALVGDIAGLNNSTKDADYFISEYKKHKNLGKDLTYIKRLVHIFHFFYTKLEIILWGENGSEISKQLSLEKKIATWDNASKTLDV